MNKIKSGAFIFLFALTPYQAQKKWALQECIDYATKNNLQVIFNEQNLKIKQNNLQMAKNESLPSVVGGSSHKLSFGQTQGFQGSVGRNDNFSNDLTISASILLYNGGKLEKQKNKASYDVEVAKYNIEVVKSNITLQIIQQYLSVLLNKEIVKVNESAVENVQKLYNRAKIMTEVGTISQSVLAEAKSSLAKEQQNLNTAIIEVKRSLFTLAQTLQLNDYQNFDIEDVYLNDDISMNVILIDDIIEHSLSYHPQIKSAENNIKSMEAQTEVIKTSFFPTISLNTGIGSFYYNSLVTDIRGIDSFGNYIKEKSILEQYKTNFYQQIGLSISIPIFNKGNTKLHVGQAKINENIAKINLETQKQNLLQNIQKISFDMEQYYQSFLSAVEVEKNTALALDFAQKSYEAGKTSIYDLSIARNNFVSSKNSVIQAKYNFLFNSKILEFYSNFSR